MMPQPPWGGTAAGFGRMSHALIQRLRLPLTARPGQRCLKALAALGLALMLGTATAQDEVPFITTPDRVTQAMLELAGVTSKDFVIDLGSGDGRIVITAAKRFGASGLGVDIAQDLVTLSRANARAAGVETRVEFRVQDLFETDLARAQVITWRWRRARASSATIGTWATGGPTAA